MHLQHHLQRAGRCLAQDYLHQITGAEPDTQGKYPVTLIHYEGNTSGQDKNLSHELCANVCEVAAAAGTTPVILDWDRRSPLPDGLRILNPGAEHPLWEGRGTGDAEILAALIDAARLMIGVDSGPLHVAGATRTPTIAVWTNHHPVHYFDLADNVLHLVPGPHAARARPPGPGVFPVALSAPRLPAIVGRSACHGGESAHRRVV